MQLYKNCVAKYYIRFTVSAETYPFFCNPYMKAGINQHLTNIVFLLQKKVPIKK